MVDGDAAQAHDGGPVRNQHWLVAIGAFILLAINVTHPLFHGLEGGSFDAILAQLNHIATFLVAEGDKS